MLSPVTFLSPHCPLPEGCFNWSCGIRAEGGRVTLPTMLWGSWDSGDIPSL